MTINAVLPSSAAFAAHSMFSQNTPSGIPLRTILFSAARQSMVQKQVKKSNFTSALNVIKRVTGWVCVGLIFLKDHVGPLLNLCDQYRSELQLGAVAVGTAALFWKVRELEKQVAAVDQRVEAGFTETQGQLRAIDGKVDINGQNILSVKDSVESLHQKVDRIGGCVDENALKTNELVQGVTALAMVMRDKAKKTNWALVGLDNKMQVLGNKLHVSIEQIGEQQSKKIDDLKDDIKQQFAQQTQELGTIISVTGAVAAQSLAYSGTDMSSSKCVSSMSSYANSLQQRLM